METQCVSFAESKATQSILYLYKSHLFRCHGTLASNSSTFTATTKKTLVNFLGFACFPPRFWSLFFFVHYVDWYASRILMYFLTVFFFSLNDWTIGGGTLTFIRPSVQSDHDTLLNCTEQRHTTKHNNVGIVWDQVLTSHPWRPDHGCDRLLFPQGFSWLFHLYISICPLHTCTLHIQKLYTVKFRIVLFTSITSD